VSLTYPLIRLMRDAAGALEDAAHHCHCAGLSLAGVKKKETAAFCERESRRYRAMARRLRALGVLEKKTKERAA
jgi:hypothetical protein